MQIRPLTLPDFNAVRSDIEDFWDSSRTLGMHQGMFVHEFGATCPGAFKGAQLLGYAVALPSLREGTLYVHLVGVRRAARGQGVARALYAWLDGQARALGRVELRAITSPTNTASIAFHRALGFTLEGEDLGAGVPVVRDYAGPGRHRVVFTRSVAGLRAKA